jgi:hypothetical protein
MRSSESRLQTRQQLPSATKLAPHRQDGVACLRIRVDEPVDEVRHRGERLLRLTEIAEYKLEGLAPTGADCLPRHIEDLRKRLDLSGGVLSRLGLRLNGLDLVGVKPCAAS